MFAVLFVLFLLKADAAFGTPIHLSNTALIVYFTPTCAIPGSGEGGLVPCDYTAIQGRPGVDPTFACDTSPPFGPGVAASWPLLANGALGITDATTNRVLNSSNPAIFFNASAIVLNAGLLEIAPDWHSMFTHQPLHFPIGWFMGSWEPSGFAWSGFDKYGQIGYNCDNWTSSAGFAWAANIQEDNWNYPNTDQLCSTCLPTLCVCAAAPGVTAAPSPPYTAMPTMPTTEMPTPAPVPTTAAPTPGSSSGGGGVDLGLVLGLSLGIPAGVLLMICTVWLRVKCRRR